MMSDSGGCPNCIYDHPPGTPCPKPVALPDDAEADRVLGEAAYEGVRSACPNCGAEESRRPYDIGSGPELSCASCEHCWGAEGQDLKPLPRPEMVIEDGHPVPMWWHDDGKLHAEPPPPMTAEMRLARLRAEHHDFVGAAGSKMGGLVIELTAAHDALRHIADLGDEAHKLATRFPRSTEDRLTMLTEMVAKFGNATAIARETLAPLPAQPNFALPPEDLDVLARRLGVKPEAVMFICGSYLGHLLMQGLLACKVCSVRQPHAAGRVEGKRAGRQPSV